MARCPLDFGLPSITSTFTWILSRTAGALSGTRQVDSLVVTVLHCRRLVLTF